MLTFAQFITEETDKRHPWEMPRDEYYKTHTNPQIGYDGFGEGKRLSQLPGHQKMWVWHSTDNDKRAEHLAKHGFKSSEKPSNLARQRYEANNGEYAEFAPGRGLSHGTYVASTPSGSDVGGRHLFAIRVKKSHLKIPPEQEALGWKKGQEGHALANDDAIITHRVHPKNVHYMGKSCKRVSDAHHEFVKYALRNGHHVPDHVLKDYPGLKLNENDGTDRGVNHLKESFEYGEDNIHVKGWMSPKGKAHYVEEHAYDHHPGIKAKMKQYI